MNAIDTIYALCRQCGSEPRGAQVKNDAGEVLRYRFACICGNTWDRNAEELMVPYVNGEGQRAQKCHACQVSKPVIEFRTHHGVCKACESDGKTAQTPEGHDGHSYRWGKNGAFQCYTCRAAHASQGMLRKLASDKEALAAIRAVEEPPPAPQIQEAPVAEEIVPTSVEEPMGMFRKLTYNGESSVTAMLSDGSITVSLNHVNLFRLTELERGFVWFLIQLLSPKGNADDVADMEVDMSPFNELMQAVSRATR